jgi:hypothetical protein
MLKADSFEEVCIKAKLSATTKVCSQLSLNMERSVSVNIEGVVKRVTHNPLWGRVWDSVFDALEERKRPHLLFNNERLARSVMESLCH